MNVYSNPENYGLTIIGDIEFSNNNYQFDTRVFFKDSDGNIFTASDAGCSCPEPFEEYTSIEDLGSVSYDNIQQFYDEVNRSINVWSVTNLVEALETLQNIKRMLKEN